MASSPTEIRGADLQDRGSVAEVGSTILKAGYGLECTWLQPVISRVLAPDDGLSDTGIALTWKHQEENRSHPISRPVTGLPQRAVLAAYQRVGVGGSELN